MKRYFALLAFAALAACSDPNAPAVTVSSVPFDITLPLGANNAPLVLHCLPVPLSCTGSYVVDGETVNVVYPAPIASPSP